MFTIRAFQDNPPKGAPPCVPESATPYKDPEAAGIPRADERGRHIDFPSFRYFFCNQLGTKLPIQVVKKLMRHLRLQMTADLYGDLEMEDVAEEVWELPALFAAAATPHTAAHTTPPDQPPAESQSQS